MSELYDSVDYDNLKFQDVGPVKDVHFYEYMSSKELFDEIRNSRIKFSEAKNKQNEFLNRLSNIKIGKRTTEQKEVINNIGKFYNSREEVVFSETILKCCPMLITMQNLKQLKELDLKY